MTRATFSATHQAQTAEVYQPGMRAGEAAGAEAVGEAPAQSAPTLALPTWADGRPRIGIHTSTAGEASRALDIAHGLGCTALQIFCGSPRMWPREHQRGVASAVAEKFRARRAELGLGPVAIHANYLINLASNVPALWERSVAAFRDELARGTQLGADYLIVHPGSSRGGDAQQAMELVAEGIARARRGLGESSPRILLENTAGQGSCVGTSLEDLRRMLDGCRARGVSPEPGVCLDTAHLFAAGYEIHTADGLQRTIEEIDRVIGLESVCVIHVNDSKAAFGSRVDRHEHIGRGKIGREAFARILNHPRLRHPGRAFLLETPMDRPGDDRRNVRMLWQLMAPDEMPPVKRGAGHRVARVRDGFRLRRRGKKKNISRR